MTASLATPRRTRRVVTAMALAAGAAVALSACGSGQISQTATQVAAITGNNASQGDILLQNVHVSYPENGEFALEPGGRAELYFTAINTSLVESDRLVGIETEDAAEVVVDGSSTSVDVELPPQASAGAGMPSTTLVGTTEPIELDVVLEDLSENIQPGLTVPMTFEFENAGEILVDVSVDAGPIRPRVENEMSGDGHSEG